MSSEFRGISLSDILLDRRVVVNNSAVTFVWISGTVVSYVV